MNEYQKNMIVLSTLRKIIVVGTFAFVFLIFSGVSAKENKKNTEETFSLKKIFHVLLPTTSNSLYIRPLNNAYDISAKKNNILVTIPHNEYCPAITLSFDDVYTFYEAQSVSTFVDLNQHVVDPTGSDLTFKILTNIDPSIGELVQNYAEWLDINLTNHGNGATFALLRATNSQGESIDFFLNILVEPTPDSPSFTGSLSEIRVNEDSPQKFIYDLRDYFSDADLDDGDYLTYALNEENPNDLAMVDVDPKTGEVAFTPLSNTNGKVHLSFQVTDTNSDQVVRSNSIDITIVPVNDAPEITKITPSTFFVDEEQSVYVAVTASDIDGDATIVTWKEKDEITSAHCSLAYGNNDHSQVTIQTSNTTISYTCMYTIIATDPFGVSDSSDVVIPVFADNDLPTVLIDPKNIIVNGGDVAPITVSAYDVDSKDVAITWAPSNETTKKNCALDQTNPQNVIVTTSKFDFPYTCIYSVVVTDEENSVTSTVIVDVMLNPGKI